MRVIKRIVFVCFCSLAVSACFEPPDFGNTPRIEFNKIEFKKNGATSEELILHLDFQDGDGDLGLSTLGDTEFPFQSAYYYLHNGLGDTTRIIPKRRYSQTGVTYTLLNYCDPGSSTNPDNPNYCVTLPGKLVTNKTRNLPNYGYLPVYNPVSSCPPYQTITTIIGDDDLPKPGVVVPLSSIDETYQSETIRLNGVDYALVSDLLLYKGNPNTNNIEVRFWQFENGDYVEYKFPGCQNYFGRFETSATDTYAGRPIEGKIRYTMKNSAFLATFGSRSIKVTVQIRDRALNVSNTIESPVFELNEIRID